MDNGLLASNWVWIVLAILMIAIAIGSLLLLLKITKENREKENQRKHALKILEHQYAKGEISDETYKKKRQTIEQFDTL